MLKLAMGPRRPWWPSLGAGRAVAGMNGSDQGDRRHEERVADYWASCSSLDSLQVSQSFNILVSFSGSSQGPNDYIQDSTCAFGYTLHEIYRNLSSRTTSSCGSRPPTARQLTTGRLRVWLTPIWPADHLWARLPACVASSPPPDPRASPPAARTIPARVVGISDGDTITVLTAAKKQVKVRLHGIDAPETGQDFGSRAKQAASELAFGKTVTIRPRDTDRYGRTVAEVDPARRPLDEPRDGPAGDGLVVRTVRAGRRRAGPAGVRGEGGPAGALEPAEPGAALGLAAGRGRAADRGGDRQPASHVYHKPTCRGAATMSEKNKVTFPSEAEAEKAGYRRAKDCW